jgi:osmotically-inducible protein OsmY
MKSYMLKLMMVIVTCVFFVSGCATAIVGGAAATGTASVAYDKRTTGTIIEDQAIERRIRDAIDEYEHINLDAKSHIVIVSYDENVLLVGQVASQAAKDKIGELAKNAEKVQKVNNELEVGEPTSLVTRSHDAWITTKIKSSSGFNDVNPVHTKVVTENSVVYLMGIVSHDQADKLTELARTTTGVTRVVRVFEYIVEEPKDAS